MALDFTSQWGAASWGAAWWGGDEDSVSLNVSATSGVGIGATCTCVLIAALACSSGIGLHAATNGGDKTSATSGVGIGATANAVCHTTATSGVGIHAGAIGGELDSATAASGVGIGGSATVAAHCTAISGIGIGGGSGSSGARAGIGIGASATCTMTAHRSATSGIGLKSLIPGHAQTVTIATGPVMTFTPGTPSVIGPGQTVVIATGPVMRFTPGMPSVNGGPTHLQVFVANVDRSLYLLPMGLTQQRTGGGGAGGGSATVASGPITIISTTIGRATATFDMFVGDNSGWVPRATQTILIQEFGKKLFAGCIKAVSCDPVQPGFTNPVFHVSCADKSSLCDGRVVIKTYLAAADAGATVLDIVQNFLNGEGVTTQGVDVSGGLGTLGSDIVGNYQTVTQVFDTIAAQTGATWWVDMDGILHFVILTSAPAAPFSITATSNNFRNLTCTESTIGYANTFYAVSNLKVLPGSGSGAGQAARSETYTFINIGGQPWQQKAFNLGLAPGYVAAQLPISTLVGVTINGVPVPVYPLSGGIQPGHGYYWFDGSNTAGVTFPENFLPSIGDVIVISYIPVYQNATVNPGTPITGTCGSGVVEGVIQVPNIQYQGLLDAIAAAYQARNGTIPFIVNFETDLPGVAVGQAMSCNLPLIGLASTTIYITGVRLQRADAGVFDLGGGSTFRCFVEASTRQNLGDFITWYEKLVARTTFPLPLDRFERASFQLAPGSSLAGGTAVTNKYIVQNTGQLYASVGSFAVAPVNQDILLDFLVNGVSVFGGDITKMLRIPAGSTANQTSTAFQSPGMFVFKGDVVTINVTYSVLAANPVAGQSGSAYLEWTY